MEYVLSEERKVVQKKSYLLVILILVSSLFAEKKKLTIKGSDTMLHLMSIWAERYMNENPNVSISITGGGSGVGIAAMLNGDLDITASSRTISKEELSVAAKRNIVPILHKVARDGITFVVNSENPVGNLSLEQIKGIYTGKITNWKELGGVDHKISVLSRQSSSGTYVYLQKSVLKREDYTPKARLMPTNASVLQEVSKNKWAIGYLGFAHFNNSRERVKVLGIQKTGRNMEPPVKPSEKTIRNKTYPISRTLNLYTNGKPSKEAQDFLDYVTSRKGQRKAKDIGYIPDYYIADKKQ
jgi:phosphate transport system substrate-binding protein